MSAVLETELQGKVLEGDFIRSGFDYSGLDKNLAEECRLAADRIRRRMKRSSEDIIEIGQDLNRIKAKLDHGKFGDWIEAEFGLTQKTANKMMGVAKKFGDKLEFSSNLSFIQPTVLYELITQDTTPEAIDEVLTRSETKVLTLKEVKQIKKDATTALEEAESSWLGEKAKLQKSEKELKNQLKVLKIEKSALEANLKNPAELEQAQLEKIRQRENLVGKIQTAKEILDQVKISLKTNPDLEVIKELKAVQSSLEEEINLYFALIEE